VIPEERRKGTYSWFLVYCQAEDTHQGPSTGELEIGKERPQHRILKDDVRSQQRRWRKKELADGSCRKGIKEKGR